MELLNQFQGFIGSIGFGFFFYMFFHPINNFLNQCNLFVKVVIFLSIFLFLSYLYFLFLVKYTFGIFNIFYPLSILIGVLTYYLFYYESFDRCYFVLISKISSSIKLKRKQLFDIINKKLERRRDNGKISKNKKQND